MNKRQGLSIIIALALLAGAFTGCGREEVPAEAALPAGYVAAGTLLTGGQETGDINAKALLVESVRSGEARETRITFDFVTGSRISGGTEESEGCGVPSYTAYTLDYPSRLVVEFPLLAHWDYTHGLAIDDDLVTATFQEIIVGDPTVRVYFQLARPVIVSAGEDGDRLTFTLRPQAEAEAQERHFVTVNAYSAYCAGNFSREVNVSPTLASDGGNILLISPPLQDEAAAQSFIMTGRLLCPEIPEAQWEICTLTDGALPEYRLASAHAAAYETPAIRHDGREQTLPVLAPNALYLSPMPGGGFLLSREMENSAPAAGGEGASPYQQLWAMEPGGQTRLLTPFEFAGIERAAFSPDGRKLAILERAQGGTHLYIFDTDTWELLNDLSEMGFGGNTSAFAWNSLGNIVYAITGTSGMQLHQFDYSIPDESQRHSIIDRNSIDEGGLGLFDGELYFCTSTLEEGAWIYRIKPEGGVRKPFLPGSAFALSSDNRYMAVLQSSEANTNQSLRLIDLAGGDRTGVEITSDVFPYDMIWSQDCKTLYYIESRIAGGQTEADTIDDTDGAGGEEPADDTAGAGAEESGSISDPYPYTLWAYDVTTSTSEAVADLCAPDLFAAQEPGVLYLNRYEADETGAGMRACYRLELAALAQPEEAGEPPEGEARTKL